MLPSAAVVKKGTIIRHLVDDIAGDALDVLETVPICSNSPRHVRNMLRIKIVTLLQYCTVHVFYIKYGTIEIIINFFGTFATKNIISPLCISD